jgi:hypothetical protein
MDDGRAHVPTQVYCQSVNRPHSVTSGVSCSVRKTGKGFRIDSAGIHRSGG